MRIQPKWVGRVFLTAVFVTGSVFAQGGKPGAEKPDAEVKFRKASQLTAQEQLAQAQKYMVRMRGILGRIKKLVAQARKDRDLIKLNCVADKRIRAAGSMKVADGTNAGLKAAIARNDAGARNHEFAKLTIAYQKVTVLGQEAEACIGEEISYVGKAKVTVEINPDVAQQGDPTVTPDEPLPITRPPIASPFM